MVARCHKQEWPLNEGKSRSQRGRELDLRTSLGHLVWVSFVLLLELSVQSFISCWADSHCFHPPRERLFLPQLGEKGQLKRLPWAAPSMLIPVRPAEFAVAESVGAALPPREPPARQQRRWTTGACLPKAPAPPPRRASTGSLRDTPSSRWRSRRYRLSELTIAECIERANIAMLAAEAKAAKARVSADSSENADPQMRFVTERRRAPLASPAKTEAPLPPPPASPVRARQPSAPPASPLQERNVSQSQQPSQPQLPKQKPADDADAKPVTRPSKPLRRTTGMAVMQLHNTAESQRIKRRRPGRMLDDERLDDDLKVRKASRPVAKPYHAASPALARCVGTPCSSDARAAFARRAARLRRFTWASRRPRSRRACG